MNERENPLRDVNEQITLRLEELARWLDKNRLLISQTNRVKITLNISGKSIVGEVTNFPEN